MKAKRTPRISKLLYPIAMLTMTGYLWNAGELLFFFTAGILGVAGTAWGWASD
jgi:hypothetical protein